PMDDNEWDVGRFDDIWSGVFLKRACDILGKQIYNGLPLCEHNKAPRSTFDDLNNEVPGLELNEHLWEIIDDVGGDVSPEDSEPYAAIFAAMADELAEGDWSDYNNGAFFNYVGEFMGDWLECLSALEESDAPIANR
ncbi:MAG: alpha-1 4-glucan-protein synthase, partial [Halohasta sp.]